MADLGALQAEVDVLKRLRVETPAELDALLPAILDRIRGSREHDDRAISRGQTATMRQHLPVSTV